ncbi:uncharacterized protein LOC125944803 isoform X2 [Dermacentor silvarum]|uniref:uncharacterized protein LOC125944803 isoform X2 n=1 Tax=Dermacentor silvarum TaxID=543639 RepID=UPI0021006F03|nr:uncharacterized protein LOC125944803 isoform X2 [Dermacentor silvarum]
MNVRFKTLIFILTNFTLCDSRSYPNFRSDCGRDEFVDYCSNGYKNEFLCPEVQRSPCKNGEKICRCSHAYYRKKDNECVLRSQCVPLTLGGNIFESNATLYLFGMSCELSFGSMIKCMNSTFTGEHSGIKSRRVSYKQAVIKDDSITWNNRR